MARLPIPGKDSGTWGDVLNDYLSQAHKSDGTLKDDSVGSAQLADNAVTNSAIAPDAITATEIQDGSILEAQLDSGVQTKLNAAVPTWGTLSGKPAVVAAGSNAEAARDAIGANYYHNILDYGVTTGTSSSQTSSIKAALDSNPGMAFFFPAGDYRLDTSLVISANNSLILAPGARIYAGASMSILIDYNNGATNADNYTEDKCLSGYGVLDGALLANTVLRVNAVLRFSVNGPTIIDGVNRGILADTRGAELHVHDVRIKNTTTSNVSDNVGIEAKMNDCRFANISMRDITVAVWDQGANYWSDIHPWLGTTTQLTARYENSVAFLLQGTSVMERPYADTYRYCFRTQADSGYVRARIIQPEVYANPGNLTDGLATAYPGVILDITDAGASLLFNDGLLRGHPTTPFTFTQGNTNRLTARGNVSPGTLTGFAEYKRGVQMGKSTFFPSVFGSTTSGSQTYASRSGYMEVRDGMVTFTFSMDVTLGATIAGNLRIGLGSAYPVGALSVNFGHGSVSTAYGVTSMVGLIGANGTTGNLAAFPLTIEGTEISTSGLASTQLVVRGQITCPFDYPA